MTLFKNIYRYEYVTMFFLVISIVHSCSIKENFEPLIPGADNTEDMITLTMQSNQLLPHQVMTRASNQKNESETAIKYMHIFFFDKDGNLLTRHWDQEKSQSRFSPYVQTDLSVVKVDKGAMADANPSKNEVVVYVIANMKDILKNVITEVDSEGYPKVGDRNLKQSDLEVLKFVHPSAGNADKSFIALPGGLMPMVGQGELKISELDDVRGLTIPLTSLMARIDFSIKIDAPSYEDGLPKLTMKSWSVHNLPSDVSIVTPENYDSYTTQFTPVNSVGVTSNKIITNGQGSVDFSFYMFENVQNAKSYAYPDGIEEKHKPKYKPKLADEKATYVLLDTYYTTYDEVTGRPSTYEVKYKIYLGANHTNDFKVKRNYQYKNDITIVGLTTNDIEGSLGKVTYDARVNLSESNPYYISMLNERVLDAHFCVLPMDVYLFGDQGTQKVVVTVDKDWVGMEKIPASNMANNSVPDEELQEKMGEGFVAGHGKRKYFTVNLVDELRKASTSIEMNVSRDRIYFYIDENLVLEDREAIITLAYYEKKDGNFQLINTEQRIINQTHLLPVEVWVGDANSYDEAAAKDKYGIVYMEAIEEYLENYDPLDPYNSTQVYDGLPWGYFEKTIIKLNYGKQEPYNNYAEGLAYTIDIIRTYGINDHDESPSGKSLEGITQNSINKYANAFIYCYNKNKRCRDTGKIDDQFDKTNAWNAKQSIYNNDGNEVYNLKPLWPGNHAKWFLPGITQLERGLEKYYNDYLEFHDNLYWSSAPGKITEKGWLGIGTSSKISVTHARATNLDDSGKHISSEKTDNNTPAGFRERDKICRVRAFRADLSKMEEH